MQNQTELDEAIIHIDWLDNKDIQGPNRVRRLGETPETGAASSQAPLVPVVEHPWHSNARGSAERAAEQETKRRSRPLRMPSRNLSGSGMQYRPREEEHPESIPSHEPRQGPATKEGEGTKRRSQPIRKFKPRVGITFPLVVQPTEEDSGATRTGELSTASPPSLGSSGQQHTVINNMDLK